MLFGKSEVTANALSHITAMLWLHLHYSSAFHDFSNFHHALTLFYYRMTKKHKQKKNNDHHWTLSRTRSQSHE
jgi:hypothetical protein